MTRIEMLCRLAVTFLVVAAACGCEGTENEADNDDTGIDGGTGGDSDADTDGDSDADGDSDTGEPADAGVIDMDCSQCPSVGSTLENMMCALDICDESVVLDTSYTTPMNFTGCTLADTYEAVTRFGSATNELAPKLNDSYALVAAGLAEGTNHSTECDDYSTAFTDPYAPNETYDIHDIVEWRMVLKAPDIAKGFRFKYVFFSEEYDEWISSVYNDKFYVILEAGSTNSGEPTVINFTACREPDTYFDFICESGDPGCEEGEKYCYIAVNSAFSECCWYPFGSAWAENPDDPSCPDGFAETDISGTGYECASSVSDDSSSEGSSTGWLQTSWPIEGGETFALTFHVHDTSDGVWDSQVILDAFQFLKEPDQGTIPVE